MRSKQSPAARERRDAKIVQAGVTRRFHSQGMAMSKWIARVCLPATGRGG